MIWFFTPYSFNKRLFDAFDRYMGLVPDENDWVCFLDGDTSFLLPDFGHQIQTYIDQYPDTAMFTCYASRCHYSFQKKKGADENNPNIIYHKEEAERTHAALHGLVKDVHRRIAGHLMVIQKKTWIKIRPEVMRMIQKQDKRILGVDTKISNAILKAGLKNTVNARYVHFSLLPTKRRIRTQQTSIMNIIGLTRVRNEAEIIEDTLDHLMDFCSEIYVYDDCSTDNTVWLCEHHAIVSGVIKGETRDKNRKRAEWQNRAALLSFAKQNSFPVADWFVYIDADERIDFDFSILESLPADVIGIRMKLFDFYITSADIDSHYSERKFCGPEYRNILMAFRNLPTLDFSSPDQREVHLRHPGKILNHGYVKHYGKGISIQQWEDTCQYYSSHFPKYSAKWERRKGKAVHSTSSFGMPLITWKEKEEKGVLLTRDIEKQSIY